MAKAMASGMATTPTTRPAITLRHRCARASRPARCASSRAIMARSPGAASWRSAAATRGGTGPRRGFRLPGLAGARLDVPADQPPQHLRRRGVLLGAQAFEHGLLARIDEGGEAGGAVFHVRCMIILL